MAAQGRSPGWVGYTVDTYLRAHYRRRVTLEVWKGLLRVPLALGLSDVLVDDLTDAQAAALAQAYRDAATRVTAAQALKRVRQTRVTTWSAVPQRSQLRQPRRPRGP